MEDEVYAPEGYPSCPFCGSETTKEMSSVTLSGHLAIERMNGSEPGSDEYKQARAEVVRFVGGEA